MLTFGVPCINNGFHVLIIVVSYYMNMQIYNYMLNTEKSC